ncbi:H-NS histone family protein [Chitinimonas naiadis]
MTIDLAQLSLPQLYDLSKKVVSEIPKRQSSEKYQALEALKRLVAERGFDLKDLLGADATLKGSRAGQPVAGKYRSKDGSATWSGRGRKPLWIAAHLEQGGDINDLATPCMHPDIYNRQGVVFE